MSASANVQGHVIVIDLTNPRRQVTFLAEDLGQRHRLRNIIPDIKPVLQNPILIRIETGHQRSTARATMGKLAVCVRK